MSKRGDVGRTAPRRLVILDFYRFVAAVGVLFFHLKPLDPVALRWVGSYGLFVDMFFVLSGFVLALTYRRTDWTGPNYTKFLGRRLARIYPLHLACLLLTVVAIAATPFFLDVAHSPTQFVENLLLIQAWGTTPFKTFNIPSWSISAELFCYLLFPLLLNGLKRIGTVAGLALVAVLFIILGHAHLPIWAHPSEMYGANADYGMIRALPSFCAGILLFRLYLALEHHGGPLWLGAGIFAMLAAVICMKVAAKPELIMILFFTAILATAVGERSLGRPVPQTYWLERLGDTSYAIYLTQMLFLRVLIEPAWPLMKHVVSFGVFAFVAVLLIVVAADLIFRLFEDPTRRAINRSFDRRVEGASLKRSQA